LDDVVEELAELVETGTDRLEGGRYSAGSKSGSGGDTVASR
jgi:hypothetical protein